ncbi:MAG: hypothetical protein M1546_00945, partial [Chloroflexi bacterium]|nr:hypothetical protein [Chloroflexota bacterium]
PPNAIDALEQRDTWRNVWQAVTSDMLLALLCGITAFAWGAMVLLPQAPANGTADPLIYSQWQTQARAATGPAFDTLSALALFGVTQTLWFRVSLAALLAVAALRLLDRAVQLAHVHHKGDKLRDEERVRVTDQAPTLDQIAAGLRAQHYRVIPSLALPGTEVSVQPSSWVAADRAPWALVLSLLLHTGLLLATLGILITSMLGWDVPRQPMDTESPVTLPGTLSRTLSRNSLDVTMQSIDPQQNSATLEVQSVGQTVALSLGRPAQLTWVPALAVPCCLSLRLVEVTPGYRISAANATGKPLTITASSYAEPAFEVMLTFRRDEPGRLIAIEPARMALLISEDDGGRVQVYGLPSGEVLTDTLIRPSIAISDTTLQFKPTTSAIMMASYRPGDVLLWTGGALALIGLAGVAVWPMQRLVVRHHGHWTEFYASGRGVRKVVRDLISGPGK